MDRGQPRDEVTRRSEGRSAEPVGHGPLRVLAAFVASYVVLEAVLTLSVPASNAFYPVSLLLLAILTAIVFAAGLFDPRSTVQRAYVALAILPVLTVARLAFSGLPVPFLDPLLVYLLMAVAILALRQIPGVLPSLRGLSGKRLAQSFGLGAVLAVGMTIISVLLLAPGAPGLEAPPGVAPLLIAPVALLDELWFRGILQGTLARATSAPWGWILTVAMFAAYGAPFGTLSTIPFRLGYGSILGALAMRRNNLPITLVARASMAAALAMLNPGFAAGSWLV